MSESTGDVHYGLFLKENNFKLVEIEMSSSGQHRINRIIQTDLDSSLNTDSIQNDHEVVEIGKQIREIIDVFKIKLQNSVFALECPFAFIKKIPVDADLSEDELIDQIDWEVKQFSYSPDDEFIVDFQRLNGSGEKNIEQIIVVSIRERIVQQLRKIFVSGKISIGVIELDVFAVIRSIKANYELKAGEIIALVGIDPNGIQITVVKNKEFILTQRILPDILNETQDEFKSTSESQISKIISKELKRIILDNNLGEDIESLQRIFLYGDMVKDVIVENLQNSYNVRIDKTNPFRKLFIGPKVSVDEKVWSHPETFAVCVGSALRN